MYPSIFRPGLFDGQVALITGGGSGIGLVTAKELSALGAQVVLAGRKEPRLEAACQEIRDAGGEARWIRCDIRKEEEVQAMIRLCVDDLGGLHLLFNNAGGQFPSPASAISSRGWDAVIATNLSGTFKVCREAYNGWMGANGGAIVNMVADMWRGFPGMAHTGAARAGVVNMTKSLAVEWARSGIRVNAIAPGIIYSSGVQTYDLAFQEVFLAAGKAAPAQRLGTMEEVSAAVSFLLSPGASYMTGTTLRVDGGSSLWGGIFPIEAHEALPPFAGVFAPPRDDG